MATKETIKVDPAELRQQEKAARRAARMRKFGQDRFAPKVEKNLKVYDRKSGRKISVDDEED